jgi:uncharacterized protein
VILADTGPLVAAADAGDDDHEVCAELLMSLAGPVLVPPTVIAEVGYLLARSAGAGVEAAFLRSFATQDLVVADFEPRDFERMAELVETYANLPLGTTDASVVALAERLNIGTVLTLDRRDFSVVRPRHVDVFELLP